MLEDGSIFQLSENTLVAFEKNDEISSLRVIKGGFSGKLGKSTQISFNSKKVKQVITGVNVSFNLLLSEAESAKIEIVEGAALLNNIPLQAGQAVEIVQSDIKKLQMNLLTVAPANNLVSLQNSMEFKWKSFALTKYYLFELADNLHFKKLIKNKKINLEYVSFEDLTPSVYFWRVKAIDTDGDIIAISTTHTFQLKEIFLPAPKIKNKKIEIEVIKNEIKHKHKHKPSNLLIDFIFSKAHAQKKKRRIELEWSKVEMAKAYKIQIARDRGFSNIIIDQEVNKNSFTWEKTLLGDFYWRVQAINSNDVGGALSEVGEITILTIPPLLKTGNLQIQKPEVIGGQHAVFLKWNAIAEAKFYRVTINGKETLTADPSFSTKLRSNSSYSWNVQALDSNKKPITRESDDLIFDLQEQKLQLQLPPIMTSPDNWQKITVENYDSDKFLIFQWQEGNFDFIELEFSRSPIFSRSRKVTVDTGVTLESKLSYFYTDKSKFKDNILIYYWRGRSSVNQIFSGWTATRSFTVINRTPTPAFKPPAKSPMEKETAKQLLSIAVAAGYGSYKIDQTTTQAGTTFNSLTGKGNNLIYGIQGRWIPDLKNGIYGLYTQVQVSSGEQQIDLAAGGQGTADLSLFQGSFSAFYRKRFSTRLQFNNYLGAIYRARYIVFDKNNEFSTTQFKDFYLSIAPELVYKFQIFSNYSIIFGLDLQSKFDALGDNVFYTLHLGLRRYFVFNWLSLSFYSESDSFDVELEDATVGGASSGQIKNSSNHVILRFGADFY